MKNKTINKETKLLNIQDIIDILAEQKIIFKCGIYDLGEDTNYDCVEFIIEDSNLFSFDYYLDLDVHGHTICGGINGWFYSPKTKEEFLTFLKEGHIE